MLFKALQLSPKKFFACVAHLASQSAFLDYVRSTSAYRCLLLTIALRQKVASLQLTVPALAKRLGMSANGLNNALAKNLLSGETGLRALCERLGIDTQVVPERAPAKPMPRGMNYFDIGTVALTRATAEKLLNTPMLGLRQEEFTPYVLLRQATAEVIATCLDCEALHSENAVAAYTTAAERLGCSAAYVRYFTQGIALPGNACLTRLCELTGITRKAFFARVVDTANALPGAREKTYNQLTYKITFTNYMEETGLSWQALIDKTGMSESYLRSVCSSLFNQSVASLRHLCHQLGLGDDAYQLPHAELRMAFTYGVDFYERTLAACFRLSLTHLVSKTTQRNYLGFRIAIARVLKRAVACQPRQQQDIAAALGITCERFSQILHGRLLIRPSLLTTLLAHVHLTPSVFWADVHALIRTPGFLADAVDMQHVEILTLKQRIVSIVKDSPLTQQALAAAAGISADRLARACSAYLPRKRETLQRLLQALEAFDNANLQTD